MDGKGWVGMHTRARARAHGVAITVLRLGGGWGGMGEQRNEKRISRRDCEARTFCVCRV